MFKTPVIPYCPGMVITLQPNAVATLNQTTTLIFSFPHPFGNGYNVQNLRILKQIKSLNIVLSSAKTFEFGIYSWAFGFTSPSKKFTNFTNMKKVSFKDFPSSWSNIFQIHDVLFALQFSVSNFRVPDNAEITAKLWIWKNPPQTTSSTSTTAEMSSH